MNFLSDGDGWLLYHSVGRYFRQAERLKALYGGIFDSWCAPGEERWETLMAARGRFASVFGGIVNAPLSSIMLSENVTSAFHGFIDSLPSGTLRGRQVLIASDCFPSLHFLLSGIAESCGFELRTVAPAEGEIFVSDEVFLAAWDERVALAVVTWVTSTTSHRADMARMVAHGRRHGSLVAIDATQGCGVVPLDVSALGADFVATATMKWLCGLPGAAAAYVAPALLSQLSPRLRGWFSQPDPFSWDLDHFRLAPDARRFDNGTPAFLCHAGAVDGLAQVAEHGVERLRQHNLNLTSLIFDAADAAHLRTLTPREESRRGGSVMIDAGDAASAQHVVEALARKGISCDSRAGRLRLSPGLTTSGDMVFSAMETIAAILGRAP